MADKVRVQAKCGKMLQSRSIFWHLCSAFMDVSAWLLGQSNYGIVLGLGLLNFEMDFSSKSSPLLGGGLGGWAH